MAARSAADRPTCAMRALCLASAVESGDGGKIRLMNTSLYAAVSGIRLGFFDPSTNPGGTFGLVCGVWQTRADGTKHTDSISRFRIASLLYIRHYGPKRSVLVSSASLISAILRDNWFSQEHESHTSKWFSSIRHWRPTLLAGSSPHSAQRRTVLAVTPTRLAITEVER